MISGSGGCGGSLASTYMTPPTKLSFRSRQLDVTRSMRIYLSNEIPDINECTPINRAVAQMPTGMEKDEEMESHLQEAIIAQQASTSGVPIENHLIPTPKVFHVDVAYYDSIYPHQPSPSRDQYIRVDASFSIENDRSGYDMDSEDELWLVEHRMELNDFEKIMEILEGASSEVQICQPNEARLLLREFGDDFVDDVYDYWLQKRKDMARSRNTACSLMPKVRTDSRRDVPGASNPYTAFRRRAEKMQTRKNRKNDEDSYDKVIKLGHGLFKSLIIMNMVRKRESTKKSLTCCDRLIAEKSADLRNLTAKNQFYEISTDRVNWMGESASVVSALNIPARHKSKKTRKNISLSLLKEDSLNRSWFKRNAELWSRPPFAADANVHGCYLPTSTAVDVCPGSDSGSDGRYAFKRRRGCIYRSGFPLWISKICAQRSSAERCLQSTNKHLEMERVVSDDRSRTSLAGMYEKLDELSQDASRNYYSTSLLYNRYGRKRNIGYARRRLGRGGRILFDYVMDTRPVEFQHTSDALFSANIVGIINASRSYDLAVEERTDVSDRTFDSENGRNQQIQHFPSHQEWDHNHNPEHLLAHVEEKKDPNVKQDQICLQEPVCVSICDRINHPASKESVDRSKTTLVLNGCYNDDVNGSSVQTREALEVLRLKKAMSAEPNKQVTEETLKTGSDFNAASGAVTLCDTIVRPNQQATPLSPLSVVSSGISSPSVNSLRSNNYRDNRIVVSTDRRDSCVNLTSPSASHTSIDSECVSVSKHSDPFYPVQNFEGVPSPVYRSTLAPSLMQRAFGEGGSFKKRSVGNVSNVTNLNNQQHSSQENAYICRNDRQMLNGKRSVISRCVPPTYVNSNKIIDVRVNGDPSLTVQSCDAAKLNLAMLGTRSNKQIRPLLVNAQRQRGTSANATKVVSLASSAPCAVENVSQLNPLLKVSAKQRNGSSSLTCSPRSHNSNIECQPGAISVAQYNHCYSGEPTNMLNCDLNDGSSMGGNVPGVVKYATKYNVANCVAPSTYSSKPSISGITLSPTVVNSLYSHQLSVQTTAPTQQRLVTSDMRPCRNVIIENVNTVTMKVGTKTEHDLMEQYTASNDNKSTAAGTVSNDGYCYNKRLSSTATGNVGYVPICSMISLYMVKLQLQKNLTTLVLIQF